MNTILFGNNYNIELLVYTITIITLSQRVTCQCVFDDLNLLIASKYFFKIVVLVNPEAISFLEREPVCFIVVCSTHS